MTTTGRITKSELRHLCCGKGHGGRDDLIWDPSWPTCLGCQTFYTHAQCLAAIGRDGENGGGALYDMRAVRRAEMARERGGKS